MKPEPERLGFGDLVEIAAKPIARALKLSCLDEDGNLKPDSRCAKRKGGLNRVVKMPAWVFGKRP